MMIVYLVWQCWGWMVDVEDQITDLGELELMWRHSQYNLGAGYEFYGDMYDKDLYTYAAIIYAQGADPSMVNPEAPPLGKYWLGGWQRLTGNIMAGQWVSLGFLLGLMVWMSRRLGLGLVGQLVVLCVFVSDGLVSEYARYVHLEWMVLLGSMVGLIGAVEFWNGGQKRWVVMAGLGAGMVMATKFYVLGGVFLMWLGTVLWIKHRRLISSEIVLMASVAVSVFGLAYWRYWQLHTPGEFIKLQIDNLRFYRGYLPDYPWMEIWRVLLVGKWRTWFSEPPIQPVTTYWIFWPLAFGLSMLGWWFKFAGKEEQYFRIILSWVVVYMIFSSTHVVFVNYLLVVIPWLYLLMVRVVKQAGVNLWISAGKHLRFDGQFFPK